MGLNSYRPLRARLPPYSMSPLIVCAVTRSDSTSSKRRSPLTDWQIEPRDARLAHSQVAADRAREHVLGWSSLSWTLPDTDFTVRAAVRPCRMSCR